MLKPFWKDKNRFWVTFDKEDARSLLEGEKVYPCYFPTNRSIKALIKNTKIAWDVLHFQKRKFDKGMHRLTGKFKMIWKNQNGLCYHCGMPMDVTEEREIFYLAPKAKAGMEEVRNMRYVHCACQRIYAENRLKK